MTDRNNMKKNGRKSDEELLRNMLADIERQKQIHNKLSEILESLLQSASFGRSKTRMAEKAGSMMELFIEAEALHAEERAAFHQLFGFEDE